MDITTRSHAIPIDGTMSNSIHHQDGSANPSQGSDRGTTSRPPTALSPDQGCNAAQQRQSSSPFPSDRFQVLDSIRVALDNEMAGETSTSTAIDMGAHQQEIEYNSVRALDCDHMVQSVSSSLSGLTEQTEVSSSRSAVSSKATTPLDMDTTSVKVQRDQKANQKPAAKAYCRSYERLNFTVRPKSSIPSDIPTHKYAAECLDAAESSRLNPYALHPDEYHLLRHHISHVQVTTYLNIRNSILRIWLQNPRVCVTRQTAVGCANARWFDAANICYDWLVRGGYINYGCVQLPDTPSTKKRSSARDERRRTVVVIGAGISGLSCARQLHGLFAQYADRFIEMGESIPRVVIVEGRSRVGGRVYSREFQTKPKSGHHKFKGRRHTAEMGGMIITGFERGNPINILVRGQLGLRYHALTAETTIYDSNGQPVDPTRDELVESLYNDCLDRVSEYKHKMQPSKLITGNRDLLDEGRDSPRDGSKTIMEAEEATAALPHSLPVSEQSVPKKVNLVPVSADKLTGRVHNQPGIPASEKVAEKAAAMGWTLRSRSEEEFDLKLEEAVSSGNATLGSVLDHALARYKDLIDLNAQDCRLFNWHIANLEYSNATYLHKLSLSLWDIDAGNEWEGNHTMIVGGYQGVARGLLQCPTPLDLMTKFAVKRIRYHSASSDGPASIESEDGSIVEADNVVCTIPLGVLKQGSVTFEPSLPDWKMGAIERLGFGVLNKVVLVYDEIFWDPERHIFGVLRNPLNKDSRKQKDYSLNRGRFFQWFNVTNTTGLPCLIGLMAGEAGFETEHSTNESLVEEATQVLRSVFGSKVPYPVESVVTRWGSDRFARGSYSSAAPEMLPEDYDLMAQSIGNLSFAGEHTIGTHPATVHGAYLSGLRAASEILDEMLGPIEVPTPLILPKDSVLLHKRKEAAKDPRQARKEAYELAISDYIRDNIGERPVRPGKVTATGYLLFSKEHFEDARRRCEENRKTGKPRTTPNDVRVMTSKMWKEATPEQRQPYEEDALAQKTAFNEAMLVFTEESRLWDEEAIRLRAAYEAEHAAPSCSDEQDEEQGTPNKYRRAKPVSYAGKS
ncbi:hypothetical protein E4U43_008260 [Claviceps pusilla]|uniref:Lysine-specific histone demethylase 1 n=1 Tax=Claviceps pusilla TaxID=123648 RepID=A0A9P7NBM2_9HYPO|nr:hypothetical protein E4U43_008260 [Claviceps pusilla]